MMAEERGEEEEERKTLPTRFEGRRAELNGCWARSVYFEERCNCSRKIFFVLDYTFAPPPRRPRDRRARALSKNRAWLPSLWESSVGNEGR